MTVGVGSTVIVKVIGVPSQPLAVGVTVIVEVTEVVPVLVAVNAPMFPVPDAGSFPPACDFGAQRIRKLA